MLKKHLPESPIIATTISKLIKMWLVTIYCSAESWRQEANAFNAIMAKYAVKPLSTKKMKDDERRIMTFELEDVGDAEAFQDECMTLNGFTAQFESL